MTVLKNPIITEKATKITHLRQYVFEVETSSNKVQIKKAIELMFTVNVDSVRTVRIKGKNKVRMTKKGIMRGKTNLVKKAYVTLREGQTIDVVTGEGTEE
ncbi:MAG: 50S ribosomal protein L23 [Ignavibacteria bacterium]|nr:50S ribosomal protein L23 [Ignavibacteria bacterium]